MSDRHMADVLLPQKRRISRPGLTTYAFHLFQERVRSPKARLTLARAIAFLKRGSGAFESLDLTELSRDGVMMFPAYISAERAASLTEILTQMQCRDPWKPERGMFWLKDAPAGTHVADIPEAPLLKAAHDIAFDERLVAIAANYFGSTPYVDSIQAWWSLAGNEQPEEAENFHRDNDGIRFLKFFLYLTEVGPDQGPHKFVRGSHVEAKLLDARRLDDAEVEEAFGRDRILTITGRPGDAFIEDTFGVHKGQLPVSGRRLLLQIRYSTTPTIFRSRVTVAQAAPTRSNPSISLIHEG